MHKSSNQPLLSVSGMVWQILFARAIRAATPSWSAAVPIEAKGKGQRRGNDGHRSAIPQRHHRLIGNNDHHSRWTNTQRQRHRRIHATNIRTHRQTACRHRSGDRCTRARRRRCCAQQPSLQPLFPSTRPSHPLPPHDLDATDSMAEGRAAEGGGGRASDRWMDGWIQPPAGSTAALCLHSCSPRRRRRDVRLSPSHRIDARQHPSCTRT